MRGGGHLHFKNSSRLTGGRTRPQDAGNYMCWERRAGVGCNNLLRNGSRTGFSSLKSHFFFHFCCFVASQKRKGRVCGAARFFSVFLFSSGKQTIFCFSFIHASVSGVPKSPLLPLCNNKPRLQSCNGVQKLRDATLDTFNLSETHFYSSFQYSNRLRRLPALTIIIERALIQRSGTVSIQSKQQKTLTSTRDFIEYCHQRNALANFIAKVMCLLCGGTLGSNLSDDLLLFVLFILFGFPLRRNAGSSVHSPPSRAPSAPQPISEALVRCRRMASREYKAVTI